MTTPGVNDEKATAEGADRSTPRHGAARRRAPRRRIVAVTLTVVGLAGGVGSAWAVDTVVKKDPPPPVAALTAPAAAMELSTPFSVSAAHVREATLTPRPSAGTEVLLDSNDSAASVDLSGAGKVVLSLAGESCEGSPVVAVDIDGLPAGTVEVADQDAYLHAVVGPRLSLGTHEVTVRMANDFVGDGCDRAAILSAARMEFSAEAPANPLAAPRGSTPSPEASATEPGTPEGETPGQVVPPAPGPTPVTPRPGGKPGPSNTGVPDGTRLTVHEGDLEITEPGTVVDGWDIRGIVLVKADDVTIRNSVVRGGAVRGQYYALIESWWGFKNLRVVDSTLQASKPNVNVDGISGAYFTAERLDISDVVDQVKVIGPGVTVRDSWLHGNFHSDNDPNQADGVTHDDNVQIEGGNGIVVENNVLSGSYNAAIMITQNHSTTAGVRIANNWLADGACTINVDEKGKGKIQGSTILGNRFGTGRYGTTCPMRLPATSPIAVTSNVWDATGAAAKANSY